jgi:hypothetical protein
MAPAPGHAFCKACNSDVPVEQNEADGFMCVAWPRADWVAVRPRGGAAR